jgi:hypothetical protein
MVQQEDSQPADYNKPLNETEGSQESHQTGEEIRDGARNEDQLEGFKQAAPPGGRDAYPELQAGAQPDTGNEDLKES